MKFKNARGSSCGGAIAAGGFLLFSTLVAVLMVEGSQVLVDDLLERRCADRSAARRA